MSNIRALHLAAVTGPTDAWPGEPELDRARALTVTPVWQIGDRVIVPPTPGATDDALRDGGPGEVVWISEDSRSGEPFAHVVVDGSADTAQPFRFDELTRQPTV